MAYAKEAHSITTAETRNVMVDMSGFLDDAEVLTGTPTIQADAALTITDTQINASIVTINGISVAVGKAISFKVASTTAGQYEVDILCATDAGQTVEGTIRLGVKTTVV